MKLEIEFDHALSSDEASTLANDILFASLQKAFDNGTNAVMKQDKSAATWWLGRLKYEISLLRPIVIALVNSDPDMTDYDKEQVKIWGQSLITNLTELIEAQY